MKHRSQPCLAPLLAGSSNPAVLKAVGGGGRRARRLLVARHSVYKRHPRGLSEMKGPFHCRCHRAERHFTHPASSTLPTVSVFLCQPSLVGQPKASRTPCPSPGQDAGTTPGTPPPGTPQAARAHTCQPGVQDHICQQAHHGVQALRISRHSIHGGVSEKTNKTNPGGTEVTTGVRRVGWG